MPKVSVLTPLYNTNLQYLKEMIESVLNQSFTDFEFLLLNDSPENNIIEQIVNSYKDNRIKYFKNRMNLGISKSRNILLDKAQGEYVAILDHDDICLPDRLKLEVDFLDNNSDVGVVSSNFILLNKKKKSDYPLNNMSIKVDLAVRGNVILHTGAMIRKSVLDKYHIKYEEEFSPCEDYMLWGRLLDKTMFHNIEKPLVLYRDYENNTSHVQSEKMQDRSSFIKNILSKEYPYLLKNSSSKSYILLFGFFPFLKKITKGNKIKYLLFGIIPVLKIIK